MSEVTWCGASPGNGFAAEAWFCRARLARGDCPCCGYQLTEWEGDDEHPEGGECDVIAEGVLICGRCFASGHMESAAARESLLRALLPAPSPWELAP